MFYGYLRAKVVSKELLRIVKLVVVFELRASCIEIDSY